MMRGISHAHIEFQACKVSNNKISAHNMFKRTYFHGEDAATVPVHDAQLLARVLVPEAQRAVAAPACQHRALGRQRHDGALVTYKIRPLLKI